MTGVETLPARSEAGERQAVVIADLNLQVAYADAKAAEVRAARAYRRSGSHDAEMAWLDALDRVDAALKRLAEAGVRPDTEIE